jgi:hypothetical protein
LFYRNQVEGAYRTGWLRLTALCQRSGLAMMILSLLFIRASVAIILTMFEKNLDP